MAASLVPLTEGHLDAIYETQSKSPGASQWSREDYACLLQVGACGWVASLESEVCGFLLVRIVADEMEILNLAVDPACRRRGIGSILLQAAKDWARQNKASQIHLEVRASNHAARKFYEAHGFRKSGLRPNYYLSPMEDALMLSAIVA